MFRHHPESPAGDVIWGILQEHMMLYLDVSDHRF